MVQWTALGLLALAAVASASLDVEGDIASSSSNRVLSRKRRFIYPSDSGWVFTATFSLVIPLTADYGAGSISFTAPFVYFVDSGK